MSQQCPCGICRFNALKIKEYCRDKKKDLKPQRKKKKARKLTVYKIHTEVFRKGAR